MDLRFIVLICIFFGDIMQKSIDSPGENNNNNNENCLMLLIRHQWITETNVKACIRVRCTNTIVHTSWHYPVLPLSTSPYALERLHKLGVHLCSVNKHIFEKEKKKWIWRRKTLNIYSSISEGLSKFYLLKNIWTSDCSSRLNYLFKHNPFLHVTYAHLNPLLKKKHLRKF